MEQQGITSAIYIGDTQGDLEAARQAGIPFIFAAYGFGNPERWDTKIEKFEDLLTL
jgi:phosphoglycolate phosphatase